MLNQNIEGYQLSPVQRRLWLLAGMDATEAYLVSATVRLQGSLDKHILQKAANAVVQRHEALRTRFCVLPGMALAVQVIDENSRVEIEHTRAEEPAPERSIAVGDSMPQLRSSPPGLQLRLVELDARNHILEATASALQSDAKSLKVIVEEMAQIYQCIEAESSAAPGPALQYADISQWLNELAEAKEATIGRKHWTSTGLRIAESLISIEECGAFERNKTETLPVTVTAGLSEHLILGESGGRWRTSEFVLTAWVVLLHKLGYGSSCMTMSLDGRSDQRLSTVVGPLTRYLPLTIQPGREQSFLAVMERMKTSCARAAKWQDCFVWELLQFREDDQTLRHFPFAFDYSVSASGQFGHDLSFSITELNGCTDQIGMRLSCFEYKGQLKLKLTWLSHLHSRQEADTIAEALATCLADAIERPGVPIRELNLVDASSAAKLIRNNQDVVIDFASCHFVHRQFSEQAATDPQAPAVVSGLQSLTYGELERRSNQLARYLQEQGVGPEVCVGLCMERGVEVIIGLLGILK
ncbi:MAG TPA: condensation domain-containing protein, partial [Candidatus Angelobacter sp.]